MDYINFITVFLNKAIRDHIVYIKQLLEYKIGVNLVCQLEKALYKLEQSS